MSTKYTAIITNEEDWWIGWIVEIPGANAQERRKEGKKERRTANKLKRSSKRYY